MGLRSGLTVLDTSVVVGFLDRNDPGQEAARALLVDRAARFVTTPFAVAEMDHLVARGGPAVTAQLWHNLEHGSWLVDWWDTALAETLAVARRHADLGLGLADASLVALAARLGTTRIATRDERHFRALRPLTGEPAFTLLPGDEPAG